MLIVQAPKLIRQVRGPLLDLVVEAAHALGYLDVLVDRCEQRVEHLRHVGCPRVDPTGRGTADGDFDVDQRLVQVGAPRAHLAQRRRERAVDPFRAVRLHRTLRRRRGRV
jgi:hypothetical protein